MKKDEFDSYDKTIVLIAILLFTIIFLNDVNVVLKERELIDKQAAIEMEKQ